MQDSELRIQMILWRNANALLQIWLAAQAKTSSEAHTIFPRSDCDPTILTCDPENCLQEKRQSSTRLARSHNASPKLTRR